jgi:hypothetical protein
MQFSPELEQYIEHVILSYQKYTNKILAKDINELYQADFICVSHYFYKDGTAKFIFGNIKALELWEMDWDEFTNLESKYSEQQEKVCLKKS